MIDMKEFLYDYGWAILILIVCSVAIYFMNVHVDENTHTPCDFWCASKGMEVDTSSGDRCYCVECEEFVDEGVTYEVCSYDQDIHQYWIKEVK